MESLNRTELVEKIAESLSLPKKEVLNVIISFIELVVSEVSEGNKINISNFGSWQLTTRKARKGRNPKTGEELQIPEKKAFKFSVSPILKKKINQ